MKLKNFLFTRLKLLLPLLLLLSGTVYAGIASVDNVCGANDVYSDIDCRHSELQKIV